MDRTARYPGLTGFTVFALDSLFTWVPRVLWGWECPLFLWGAAILSVPIATAFCEAAFVNTVHHLRHRQGEIEALRIKVMRWIDLFFGFIGLCFGIASTLAFSIHENFDNNWVILILVVLCCNGVGYYLWSNWRSYGSLRRTLSALVSTVGVCLTWYLILMTFRTGGEGAMDVSGRDFMIQDMINLAAVAHQYRIRPQSEGGGSGSFGGFVMPKRMASNENGEYSVIIISVDTIEFIGVARDSLNGVSVKVDSTGKLHAWRYRGDYQ